MSLFEKFKRALLGPPEEEMWLWDLLAQYRLSEDPDSLKQLSDAFPQMPSGHVQCGICGGSLGVSSIVGWCRDYDRPVGETMYLVCPECFDENVDETVYRLVATGTNSVMRVAIVP